jgi:hypothetical protein
MVDVLGGVGAFGVLFAYFIVTKYGMRPKVQVINLLAALALTVYSVALAAWANVGLNVAWFFIAAYGLVRLTAVPGPDSAVGFVSDPYHEMTWIDGSPIFEDDDAYDG